MNPLRVEDSVTLLRCPVCRGALKRQTSLWQCVEAQHAFPEVDGIPVLVNAERSIFRIEDFHSEARTTFKGPPSWALSIGRILPSPSRDVSSTQCQQIVASNLRKRPPHARRVLVVGCGDGTASYGEISEVPGSLWLETDVSLAGRAAIICDASDLPFADGEFDLVISTAVLEHVLEPERCVEEMHRVLAENGLIYATTPFMQQVHMGEYDFTRFTHGGHRWLFRKFEEFHSGVATGPASVVIWSIEYFFLSWTRSLALRRVIKGSVRLLLGWITIFDVFLSRRTAALDAAGGFCFIGQRANKATVSARDMITYYRGSDSQK